MAAGTGSEGVPVDLPSLLALSARQCPPNLTMLAILRFAMVQRPGPAATVAEPAPPSPCAAHAQDGPGTTASHLLGLVPAPFTDQGRHQCCSNGAACHAALRCPQLSRANRCMPPALPLPPPWWLLLLRRRLPLARLEMHVSACPACSRGRRHKPPIVDGHVQIANHHRLSGG